ncbi:hypothetical protein COS50_03155 [Candidatus Roizmanbacteria bacterium CG03_land_8_20_14_0_80_35_26]|uniref:Uncharacterized protein n=1 Tax=Candidatus Roizmanbacteria bacterium CG03_land_8_20_14_0_80_35_26 TaxID=1974845 RepID=A0A2M7BWG8_9BACT|nr:MAG: hypothetical protein COS50_03155 [Candidatus Roizmanbacteria bacterium CG03_land_8_20_14_0_80_35_26]
MQIIINKVSLDELKKIAQSRFGNLIKAVIDVEKEILVVDSDLHSDEEALLLSKGSKQENLWGINLYPDLYGKKEWIEFDSMINLRPSFGNRTRGIDSIEIQKRIIVIVNKLIIK